MSRSGSVCRIQVAPEGRREVRFLKNCYAPIAHMRIVIKHGYYQTLTAVARVGTGKY